MPDMSFGYSIDDNARALIAAYQYFETYHDESVLPLAKTYFSYIQKAKIAHGYFHNFADKDGKFIDEIGSETSSARVIWALGYIVNRKNVLPEVTQEAIKLLNDLPPVQSLDHLRSKAYALIGHYYLGDKKKVSYLADNIVASYQANIDSDWFEPSLTYGNAIIVLSLFMAYLLTENKTYKEIGLKSLIFLNSTMRQGSIPSPVSHLGWTIADHKMPVFDQQAIDAANMVLAALAAQAVTKEDVFSTMADDWFGWFEGNNVNHISLIDQKSGGCYDGLTSGGVNLNQGAESIVCYLLAYLGMQNPKLLSSNKLIKFELPPLSSKLEIKGVSEKLNISRRI